VDPKVSDRARRALVVKSRAREALVVLAVQAVLVVQAVGDSRLTGVVPQGRLRSHCMGRGKRLIESALGSG